MKQVFHLSLRHQLVLTKRTSFSDGDAIGVYAVDKATGLASSGNICDNKKYVFASSTQSFKAASQADKIFNYDNKDLEFYVYYPYSSSIDDATNVMHVLSGVREDDFLVAKTSGSGNALPLNFRHLLSKIRVNYTPDQASSDLSMSVNTYKACVINLANNQIDKVGNRAALLLEKTQLESVTEFAGVIVPQTYTQSTLFGTITAGANHIHFHFRQIEPLLQEKRMRWHLWAAKTNIYFQRHLHQLALLQPAVLHL